MGETEHNTFPKGVIRGLLAPSPAGGRAWPGPPKRRLKRPRGLLSCLSSRCAGGRRGPRVLQTRGSRETHVSQRTLKRPGVRARVCREGERGAWESTLQDHSSRRRASGVRGFRCRACRLAGTPSPLVCSEGSAVTSEKGLHCPRGNRAFVLGPPPSGTPSAEMHAARGQF